ncbi:MAG: 2-oxoacid:acceptor oxidoreductase family protein [Deltaproteobacteria bacterium]|nr:2-oxoacid:acceptor oxidoreductase family protein [Deltaproteobacteria bacterium]
MLEIRFSGRGGQGVVVASQMLGLAFFKAGAYPQCYSLFGGERRGAPVVAFLRVDEKKILLKCEIGQADELLCFDDGLLGPAEIRGLVRPGGRLLINTHRPPESFAELAEFEKGFVDGAAISRETGLPAVVNSAMLGAYARFGARLPLETVLEAIAEGVPAKHEENREAAKRAHERVVFEPARS